MSAVGRTRYRIFVSATSDGLTDHRPHGDGLIALSLVRELASRGHEIHLAGTRIDVREPLPTNVHFHALQLRGSETFAERILYAVAVRRLYDRLARVKAFDVVHQMNPVIAGLSLGFAFNAPPLVLGAYHENWADRGSGVARPPSLAMRFLIAGRAIVAAAQQVFAAAIVIATSSARNRMPFAALLGGKIAVIPHGIDLDRFRPLERDAAADDAEPAVLFLANLVRRKGIFTLLEAFEIVARRVPTARLVVAGRGDEESEVAASIARSPARDRISLLGNVARGDIAQVMRGAAVYCLPSFGEPFGMTAIEAMACGLPVVVTREGGLGEFVPDDAGGKVSSRDPAALAEAIVSLLQAGAGARREIGARNRGYVERYISLPRVAEEWERVYERVVAERASAGANSRKRVAASS